jgi:predicted porin
LAALAVSGAAFAQSTVTLSGTFDPSYSKATTTTAAGAKTSATTLGNSLQGTTGIKFSGTEDLGGGLKAIFMLEQNFDSTDGTNGAFAAGEVFAGLSGGFGTIRLGAANSPTLSVQAGRTPFGTKVGGGYNGSTSGTANTRNDDSIVYTSPTMGGFSIGIAQALKVAASAAGTANTTGIGAPGAAAVAAVNAKSDIALNYAAGPLVVGLSSVTQKGALAQTNLMAQYNLGFARLYAGYVSEDNKAGAANSKKKGTNIAIAAPMGALTLMANVASWDVAGGTTGDRDLTAVGVKYDLSKRTSTYARLVTDKTEGGSKVQTTLVGLQHNF